MKSQTFKNLTVGSLLITFAVAGAYIITPQITRAAETTVTGSTASSTDRTRDNKPTRTRILNKFETDRGSSTASTTRPRLEPVEPAHKNTDNTCMAKAVANREDALLIAWTGLNTDLTEAFTKRSKALIAAWSNEDKKAHNAATVAAWKGWKDQSKAAYTEFKTDRKTVWETFKNTTKTDCKATLPPTEALERSSADMIAI